MSVRVVAGKAKGRKLKTVPGEGTRPILTRIKENLFNILGTWVRDTRWLDLFAGTGSVGIEALSRGAEWCLFLDTSSLAVRTLHENLDTTGLAASAEVRRANAFSFLEHKQAEYEPFDVIYVAPPQYKGMWRTALEMIDADPSWLTPDGIVTVQIDPQEYEEVPLNNLDVYDIREYGKTMLCFYERLD
jgi:16S rRNA (guanine966-N2)-methyltransferase